MFIKKLFNLKEWIKLVLTVIFLVAVTDVICNVAFKKYDYLFLDASMLSTVATCSWVWFWRD